MVSEGYRADLNIALQIIAGKLDIDQTRYDKAEKSYKAVGEWLEANGSSLLPYVPKIYFQGSFLLGTVVKPIDGDYDLDFVCLLKKGEGFESQQVFQIVGERLKENGTYARLLTRPKNRCWRLVYAGDFHVDIIPAIPDVEQGDPAIKVPDRNLQDWSKSNPKGYWDWFKGKMQMQFNLVRKSIAFEENKEIEEIEEHRVKTELQRAVQLMKRHRDIMFQDDEYNKKPISIIITTLAGHVYEAQGYQEDLFYTLSLQAEYMPQQVQAEEPRVANPTNFKEDFADKWPDHPEREKAFFDWMAQFKADLEELGNYSSLKECEEKLKQMFGETVVSDSLEEVNEVEVSKSRFDVRHRQDPASKWIMAINSNNQVTIRGYIEKSDTRGEEFPSDSSPIEKGESIYFLANTRNIDRPYEVHWQVVNTGYEAAAVENGAGLRGGFEQSNSPKDEDYKVNPYSHKRYESTSYTGMHWVEAFIIKNGVCIARSGEFVVNIK